MQNKESAFISLLRERRNKKKYDGLRGGCRLQIHGYRITGSVFNFTFLKLYDFAFIYPLHFLTL